MLYILSLSSIFIDGVVKTKFDVYIFSLWTLGEEKDKRSVVTGIYTSDGLPISPGSGGPGGSDGGSPAGPSDTRGPDSSPEHETITPTGPSNGTHQEHTRTYPPVASVHANGHLPTTNRTLLNGTTHSHIQQNGLHQNGGVSNGHGHHNPHPGQSNGHHAHPSEYKENRDTAPGLGPHQNGAGGHTGHGPLQSAGTHNGHGHIPTQPTHPHATHPTVGRLSPVEIKPDVHMGVTSVSPPTLQSVTPTPGGELVAPHPTHHHPTHPHPTHPSHPHPASQMLTPPGLHGSRKPESLCLVCGDKASGKHYGVCINLSTLFCYKKIHLKKT